MPLPLVPLAVALAQFAPSLMRYFGAGESSAAVAEQVAGIAIGVTGARTPEEALAALRADVQLQAEFAHRALELDVDLERAYLADRQDARRRDVELARAGRTNTRANAMVAFDAAGLIACLVTLTVFRSEMPGEVVGLVSTIASIFGLCLRDAHQFEFGSSRGSRDKDDRFAQLAAAVPAPAAAPAPK